MPSSSTCKKKPQSEDGFWKKEHVPTLLDLHCQFVLSHSFSDSPPTSTNIPNTTLRAVPGACRVFTVPAEELWE
jgi:hypothetical protein